jgi:hypothetical protein
MAIILDQANKKKLLEAIESIEFKAEKQMPSRILCNSLNRESVKASPFTTSFRAFLLCTITQRLVWHLLKSLSFLLDTKQVQ